MASLKKKIEFVKNVTKTVKLAKAKLLSTVYLVLSIRIIKFSLNKMLVFNKLIRL